MQIKIIHKTEIRSSSTDLTEQTLIGQVFERAVIVVEDMVYPGAVITGNDDWFRDANGWFYWSGFALPVLPEMPATETGTLNGTVQNGNASHPETTPLPETPVVVAILQEPDEPVFEETLELMPFGETRLPEDDTIDEGMMGIIDWPDDTGTGIADFSPRNFEHPGFSPKHPQAPPLLQEISAEKLNWGIRLLDIQQQYWISKQATGKGVRIALLGTGVATNCEDIQIAEAFIIPGLGDNIADLDGMGTQAAMAAAGRGKQRCGVAPEAILLAGKIGALHHTITPQALLDGLDWAIAYEADIIVVLTHFARPDAATEQLLQQKIAEAVSANIVVIAPAGHASDHFPGAQYPAAFPGVLSVGACNELGQRSAFSSKNGKIDLLAPGEGLEVVSYDGKTVVPNTPDTAIAAAFAAGCIALMINDYRNKNKPYSAIQILDNLKMTAFNKQKYGVNEPDAGTGYGLLRLP